MDLMSERRSISMHERERKLIWTPVQGSYLMMYSTFTRTLNCLIMYVLLFRIYAWSEIDSSKNRRKSFA